MDHQDDASGGRTVLWRLKQLEEEVRGPHGVVGRLERRLDGIESRLNWIFGVLLASVIAALVTLLVHHV